MLISFSVLLSGCPSGARGKGFPCLSTQHFSYILHLWKKQTHHLSMKAHKHNRARTLRFFSMLLALLGLGAGCEELGIVEVMYGSPTAHFSVKGKVTDESGNPIQNIEVYLYGVTNYEGQDYAVPNPGQPVMTDSKGTYLIERSDRPYSAIQVNVKDIDGASNGGEFASDSLRNSSFTFIKDKNDKSAWSVGTADIKMPDIKLKKK